MLHSFWYSAGEQAFRDALKDDPGCAIATWGIASILMSNPLAGRARNDSGSAHAAEMAGDRVKAAAYSRKLLQLAQGADVPGRSSRARGRSHDASRQRGIDRLAGRSRFRVS